LTLNIITEDRRFAAPVPEAGDGRDFRDPTDAKVRARTSPKNLWRMRAPRKKYHIRLHCCSVDTSNLLCRS
jgi:hypothetical protein